LPTAEYRINGFDLKQSVHSANQLVDGFSALNLAQGNRAVVCEHTVYSDPPEDYSDAIAIKPIPIRQPLRCRQISDPLVVKPLL
jgi:hypothetical protein